MASLWIYASAVVGITLTKRVLVSKVFTDESVGSSEKQKHILLVKSFVYTYGKK